ncbi:uncharacterized protein LOC143881355 isoform X2 [Tasmannia lanceolata]|uniref:uncharacterized protein LOC143881355 isoform X2 n=1 Tax=Tasmannia lanceolata TaxID=3420 RepID=UPI004063F6DC
MLSISSSLRHLLPQWRSKSENFCIFLHSNRKIAFISWKIASSMNQDSVPIRKQGQLHFDPSEDLFGLEVDLRPRKAGSGAPKPRSWFGPNGQYIRELPCPCCRGRGYTPCTECGIERSRLDCSQCHGKGLRTCRQCLGDCVIWEESIDEQPWEKARSRSPFKVKEDDEVDNLDIKLAATRKSKRIYQSPSPEVGLKISRSLRVSCLFSLNAKTGLFSKRMKILHRDPKLHAQRVAAIKKAKGTAAARKRASEALKAFFHDPENRRKRSISMKGVNFYCSNCGREGHRRYYCPELKDNLGGRHKFKCGLCGEKGHNRRTCRNQVEGVGASIPTPIPVDGDSFSSTLRSRTYSCSLCLAKGHNIRTCPNNTKNAN